MELLCCRFQEVAFAVPAHSPPQYGAPRRVAPVFRKACDYCSSDYASDYRDHLTTAHKDRIFYCRECDNYIGIRDFYTHMSAHATEYSSHSVKDKQENKKQKRNKNKHETKDENENTKTSDNETVQQNKNTAEQMEITNISKTNAQSFNKIDNENDFSDHSDTEYDFGPLPDSVFEAIEDTQDGPMENNDTPNLDVTDSSAPVTNNIPTPAKSKGKKCKRIRKCATCAKEYTNPSSYFYHVKHSHKRTKEHTCQICNREFGTKCSLNRHASVHTGECPFECNECGKKFRYNASLYIHKQTHIGHKDYSCTQCDASFRWKTHLGRHVARHAKEKGHVCTTCGRGFSIRCDLQRHAKTHEGRKITCDTCGTKFSQPRYLKVHMRKKHPSSAGFGG